MQQPAVVYKCNHSRCLACPFLREGQTNYIFTAANELRKVIDTYPADPEILSTYINSMHVNASTRERPTIAN